MITLEEYLNHDEMCVSVVRKKYLEYPDQPIEEFYKNVIENICDNSVENTQSDKQTFVFDCIDDWYKGIWKGAGSILAAGPSRDKKISVFNCTGLKIPEDSIDAIADTRKFAAKMAAHRQGLGVEFSNLRPRGAKINNSAVVSEGAVHWMKSFDTLASEVGQRGRLPAMLFALDINHPDIEEFITCKDDVNSINNANISVFLDDNFMKEVVANMNHRMVFTTEEGETIEKEVPARKLFAMICKQAWKNGEPGIIFRENMKNGSIQEALGENLVITNACAEKPLPDQSVCCLAPLNMEFVPNPTTQTVEFHDFMKRVVPRMVRFMDDVVQYEIDLSYKSPTEKQANMVKKLREIGLGILNLHKWFYNNNVAYGSLESIRLTDEFFKWYIFYAFSASVELAKQRGPCEAWSSMKSQGKLEELMTPFLHNLFTAFPQLKDEYLNTGIRNAALLSVAPTGTVSMTFPNMLSTGIEPLIGYAYWRRTRALSSNQSYDNFFVLPHTVKTMLLEKIPVECQEDLELIQNTPTSQLDQDGEIGKKVIAVLNKYIDTALLQPSHLVDPFAKIQLMAAAQKWIDASISVTYNVPFTFTEEETQELYKSAWTNKLKSITIYRDGSREGIYIFEDPITYAKKLATLYRTEEVPDIRPTDIQYHRAPKRPEELPCEMHHTSIKGEQWLVLVGLLNGHPYEVFAGKKNEDFNISKNIQNGTIIKNNKGVYTLRITTAASYIDYHNIADLFMNVEYKALTRLISLSLRHGVYSEFILEQLKKSSEFVSDFMAVISRVLTKYSGNVPKATGKTCPQCGASIIKVEGCEKCSANCGYSRCE